MNKYEAAITAGVAEHFVGMMPRTVIDYQQFVHKNNNDYYKLLYNQGGLRRFYKGAVPLMTGVTAAHIGLFQCLEIAKKKNDPIADIYYGAAGRLIHDLCIVPGDIIRMRSNLQNISTMETVKEIYKNFGIRGFYKGLTPSLAMNIPSGVVEFSVHNALERKFGTENYIYTNLTTGFLSALVKNPIDTIKTCMQSDKIDCCNNKGEYRNIYQTATQIYERRGLIGFFRGFGLRSLQTTICFGVYDYLSNDLKDN